MTSLPWLATADGASPWPQATVLVTGLGVSGFAAADGLLEFGARVVVVEDTASEVNADKAEGTFKKVPDRDEFAADIKEALIVELYSR